MSEATETRTQELEKDTVSEPQVAASPEFELSPFEDTRSEEQKAADEEFHKQLREYQELCERGEVGKMSYNSVMLHRLAGRFSILRELQRAFTERMVRFMKPESEGGYGLTMEEAIKKAESLQTMKTAKKLFNDLKFRSVGHINWIDLDTLFRLEPAAAEAIWSGLKSAAREDFEGGSFAAKIFETSEWKRDPWRRAQYVGIRDAFIDDYQPRGAIELSMVEMAVTAYFLYYYWTDIMMKRTETEALPSLFTAEERRKMEKYEYRYSWVPPRVYEQEALEHAAQMADRFRRQYLAALRAMRDYRRWGSPVVINNEGQVNIAADGGQQVNVQRKSKTKTKAGVQRARKLRAVK